MTMRPVALSHITRSVKYENGESRLWHGLDLFYLAMLDTIHISKPNNLERSMGRDRFIDMSAAVVKTFHMRKLFKRASNLLQDIHTHIYIAKPMSIYHIMR